MNHAPNHQEHQPIIFWILWASILSGIFVIQFFAAGGMPTGENMASPPTPLLLISLSGVLVSIILRWLVLPQMKSAQSLLTVMIIGLALAEGTAILGMFVIGNEFPSTQRITLILSVFTVLQYIPLYATKFIKI